jgi:hypothetical protein
MYRQYELRPRHEADLIRIDQNPTLGRLLHVASNVTYLPWEKLGGRDLLRMHDSELRDFILLSSMAGGNFVPFGGCDQNVSRSSQKHTFTQDTVLDADERNDAAVPVVS